jgi:hypothetical protein
MIHLIAAEVALCVSMQVGMPAPAEAPGYPALGNAFGPSGVEGQFEQRYPFDSHQNWVHGYHQEIPAYGGHVFFRPYNYKDVLSQSQTSAGWGQPPTMPYSQQFWHKYQDQATMLKMSHSQPLMPMAPHGQMQPAMTGYYHGGQPVQQEIAPVGAYWNQPPAAVVPSTGTRFPIAP